MSETRTIVVSIVGTGLATVTVMVAFTAIIASGINARFDDVNRRIDDVNRNVNGRIGDLNARMTGVEADIRELRTLVVAAIEGETAPD